MTSNAAQFVAFTCAYTPLPLLAAAGFVPLRLLPLSAAPDQAGTLLHDNLCPHVKRVLDRALQSDLPDLRGVVLMNSCDAMRRLADAWTVARPDEPVAFVDLPVNASKTAVRYLADEFELLAQQLSQWSGRTMKPADVEQSVARYNQLAEGLELLTERVAKGELAGGAAALQQVFNESVSQPVEQSIAMVRARLAQPAATSSTVSERVPVYLFGNVLPEPEGLAMFEACGCQLIAPELCTGSRQITKLAMHGPGNVFERLARAMLGRPICGRTIDESSPAILGRQVAEQARQAGAGGVIAYVMKFCDPYLARLPAVREQLEREGLPLLILEGDCTLGSLGQQRTRIEAFVEMLGGQS